MESPGKVSKGSGQQRQLYEQLLQPSVGADLQQQVIATLGQLLRGHGKVEFRHRTAAVALIQIHAEGAAGLCRPALRQVEFAGDPLLAVDQIGDLSVEALGLSRPDIQAGVLVGHGQFQEGIALCYAHRADSGGFQDSYSYTPMRLGLAATPSTGSNSTSPRSE